ncbi:ribosomal RNA processing protein 36 homolog [Poecilia reticulata]|uniref:rRNA biogenesis protein RRP36 n=1 Tax=Poecilia reticulata TaxID=8081 RepID=A0A3P9QIY9_POERE|nr:PREDICTED: ribosomal RNA processing protein 36 homolog [Poecilia reticulata]
MRRREKQRQEAERKRKTTVSCSEEEDSDVEKKVSLFTLRGGEAEELRLSGHDDEDQNQSGDGAEEDSGDSEEEVSEGKSNDEEDDEEEDLEEEEDTNAEEDDDDDDDDEEAEEDHTGDGTKLQTEERIRKELSNMPFEDVIKLQQQVGNKAFNEVAFNNKKCRPVSSKKRLNKNRPMEISAKTPPSFLRQVIPAKKSTRRDPRFDSLSGEYKPEIFEKTYKFITDLKHKEKEVIKKQLKKTKTDHKKEKLQFLLKRLDNQERVRLIQEQQRERELQFKKQQRERASRGERPFFLKKSEKKKLQLAEKYQELKKSGKLENFLSKKRKRNAGKDHRKLPEKQLHNKKPFSS